MTTAPTSQMMLFTAYILSRFFGDVLGREKVELSFAFRTVATFAISGHGVRR
jgi:hypothetical protein